MVKKRTKLDQLLEHPKNARISFSGRSFRVRSTAFPQTKAFPGLKPSLEWLFPEGGIQALVARNKTPTGRLKKKKFYPSSSNNPNRIFNNTNHCNIVLLDSEIDENGCKGLDDKGHGSIVDLEMQQFVISHSNLNLFRTLVPKPDPCTVALLNEIQSRGWTLRSSQFGMFDDALGVATAIDLLAETRDGKLVLLEQKVTKHRRSNYYEKSHGVFQGPLQNVPFSLLNVDMVQLLSMALMLHYSYGITVDEAYLVRVGQGQLWIYGFSDWCITKGDDLYQAMKVRSRLQHSINRYRALHRCRRPPRRKRK